MQAVFDQNYVKRLHGTNVKRGKNKRDLAEQVRADIQAFKKNGAIRLVMIWCGSTEIFLEQSAVHQSLALSKRPWKPTIRRSRPRRFMPMRR